jgi:DNA polymerase
MLSIDIETYSSVDLARCGVYAYTQAADFTILLFGYTFNNDPVQVIDLANNEAIPDEIISALTNSTVIKTP